MCLRSEVYKKNVATSEMFSYVIGYYSVNVPSQPLIRMSDSHHIIGLILHRVEPVVSRLSRT